MKATGSTIQLQQQQRYVNKLNCKIPHNRKRYQLVVALHVQMNLLSKLVAYQIKLPDGSSTPRANATASGLF